MLESTTLVLATAAIAAVIVWLFNKSWKNRPPGPTGIPVLGNLYQLAQHKEDPLSLFEQWRETYGEIYSFHLGQYKCVLLSGYDTIKEAYNNLNFNGRYLFKPFHAVTNGEKLGILLSEGQTWSEQRRFALRHLRDFGFGKKSMEAMMQEDIAELIEHFKESKGEPLIPHRKFSPAVVKSLWNIIAGERFSYGDPKFQKVLDDIGVLVSDTSAAASVFFLPWLANLFPEWSGWNKRNVLINKVKDLIQGYIKEHQRTFDKDSVRDFMDVYLKEIEETKDKNSSFYKENGEKNLLYGALNLFTAGSDTTSNTLVWALLYLSKYPKVQERLYKEICNIAGTSRLPSLEDRDSCLYTWAVMEEVLRMSSLVAMGVPHCIMQDTTFKGYFLPKDTIVFSNLYGVHYDKKIWGDPEVFRPERFLVEGKDGKLTKNPNAGPCIPFLIGKRACLGEVLARNNFFLYLTSLVQKFEFQAENKEELDMKAKPGLIRIAKDFSVVLKERK